MHNHHNKTLSKFNLYNFFNQPKSERQKMYEAIRAIIVEDQSIKLIAKKFKYKVSTLYSLLRDAKAGKLNLFPEIRKGPQQKRTSIDIQKKIIEFRKAKLSVIDIHVNLLKNKIDLSESTIERLLKDSGYLKLKRRTNKELGKTKKNEIIPERSAHLDFKTLETFNVDCPVAGAFFFIPYILELGILDIVKKCKLPASGDIGSKQASLSMLLLKLIGVKRLSSIRSFDQEQGLGIFAGLNVLPKPTYMNTYSCRCSQIQLMELQEKIITNFKTKYPEFYKSTFINLDFHSIPHSGDESEMEKIWCGAKHQTMKGANTIFAQDSKSNVMLYTKADILRSEESNEINNFISYWKKINGKIDETLVFDCKFTKYKILDELNDIKFITLRRRSDKLINDVLKISKNEWKKVYLPIPKRKYKSVSVYESKITLDKCNNEFRQIIVKDHGRSKPTFILTNNWNLALKEVLEVYAKRWHIESKLGELVTFFNLNALSSPIMIRIHFDILWTVIADTLYHRFSQDLRRFEKNISPTIFKKFINMPGRVIYNGKKFQIKIRKRATTPILKGVKKLSTPFSVPWLNDKPVEIIWTA